MVNELSIWGTYKRIPIKLLMFYCIIIRIVCYIVCTWGLKSVVAVLLVDTVVLIGILIVGIAKINSPRDSIIKSNRIILNGILIEPGKAIDMKMYSLQKQELK